jgi:hypothetical protein
MSSIVFSWLDRIGLGYAIPHFTAQGITSPQALAAVDLAQGAADALQIHDDEDKKRLWELIHRIRSVSYNMYLNQFSYDSTIISNL